MYNRNQMQNNYYNNCEIMNIVGYDYHVGDKAILGNKVTYKQINPCKETYEIIQRCTNGVVTLWIGATPHRLNTRQIVFLNILISIPQLQTYILLHIHTAVYQVAFSC